METETERGQVAVAPPVVMWAVLAEADRLTDDVGPLVASRLLRRYGQLWQDAVARFGGSELRTDEGQHTATFRSADGAIRAALFLQHVMRHERWAGRPLRAKVGIHADHDGARQPRGGRTTLAVAGALAEAAAPGQIVVTRPAFDEADRACLQHPPSPEGDTPSLAWVEYGRYLIAGGGEAALGIVGIGAAGVVSDSPPAETARLRCEGGTPAPPRVNVQSRLGSPDEPMTLDVTAHPAMDEPTALPDDAPAHAGRRSMLPPPSSGSGDEDTQPFERAADPLLNRTLGDYRIVERIGSGGMGKVYRAQHRFLECDAAVKVLHDRYLRNPGFLTRFHHEAKVMRTLDHPHIVRVLTLSEHEGLYYLVMDFVTGPRGRSESLHDYLKSQPRGRLPEDEARVKAMEIADALAYIHRNQVVHLDLKPGNILLDHQGRLKLTDFGLAKVVGTEVTGIRGTEGYMPSEQCGKGNTIDQRADVYAFGVVLYRMLTGTKIVGLKPSEAVPGLATTWDKVVEKCTQADPAARYACMEEVIRDLSPPAPPPLPVRESAPRRTRAPVYAFAGLGLVGAVLGSLVWAGVMPLPIAATDPPPPLTPNPPQEATVVAEAPRFGVTIDTLGNKTDFRAGTSVAWGDDLNFTLTAKSACFVVVLILDAAGDVTVLAPSEFQPPAPDEPPAPEAKPVLPITGELAAGTPTDVLPFPMTWVAPLGRLRVVALASEHRLESEFESNADGALVRGLGTPIEMRGEGGKVRVNLGDLILGPSEHGIEMVERTIHILPPEGNP